MSNESSGPKSRKRGCFLILIGLFLGVGAALGFKKGIDYSSTDLFCDQACHVHPHANEKWIKSTHYTTKSGVVTHCIDCHLPGGGIEYYTEKARLGAQDVYGKLFKDVAKIDWAAKRSLDHAKTFTYDSACVRCHQILFSAKLTKKGVDGHLHYQRDKEKMRCISCHLDVGHWRDKKEEPKIDDTLDSYDITAFPMKPEGFKNYTEVMPGTDVKFEMVAVQGGEFMMGSPSSEALRQADEGPQHQVRVSPFWIGKTEVRWREWEVFFAQRGVAGREDSNLARAEAATGPTPPYGSPDQGWGKGSNPVITMTHHAAMVYCEWLSQVTGKKYRLPTEAEWEYACRAGTTSPYFFPGTASDFVATGFFSRLIGPKTEPLTQFTWYQLTSNGRSHPPTSVKPNPWGVYNMLGNVKEFCLDFYDPQAYAQYPENEVAADPRGPESGEEHVIRGGSFKSDASMLRSAARDRTRTEDWLMTDPQVPKSIWWYSDSNDVGFRVVCEYRPAEATQANPPAGSAAKGAPKAK